MKLAKVDQEAIVQAMNSPSPPPGPRLREAYAASKNGVTATRHSSMRQFAAEYDNAADATEAYLDSLSAEEMRDELYPHVRDRMGHLMRAIVSPAEDRQFPDGWQENPPQSIGDLAEEVFSLLDGTRVAWGKATAEQHEARAAMQRAYASRSLEDAKRHDWAAAEIRKRGVTCLDDLEV